MNHFVVSDSPSDAHDASSAVSALYNTYTHEEAGYGCTKHAIHEIPMSKDRSKLCFRYSCRLLLNDSCLICINASSPRHCFSVPATRITASRKLSHDTDDQQASTITEREELYIYIYICIYVTSVSRCRSTIAGLFTVRASNSIVWSSLCCQWEERFRLEQQPRADQTSSRCRNPCIVPSRYCRYVRDVSPRSVSATVHDIRLKYFEK